MNKISKLGFARQQPVANSRVESLYWNFFINEVLSEGNGFHHYQREIMRKMLKLDVIPSGLQNEKSD